MRGVCIRCGKKMEEDSSGSAPRTEDVRTLCNECASAPEVRTRMSWYEFIDSIAAPVILFDSERKAAAANRHACEVLGKGPERVEGLFFGDVFECGNARLPGGCGHTVHCSGCEIRRAVMDTLIFERNAENVPVYLHQPEHPESADPDYLLSTEKKFNLVLVRIDAVRGCDGERTETP